MKLYCKICNVLLGDIQEGRIATKKLVCLCNKCYKYLEINKMGKETEKDEFLSTLYKVAGLK